MTIQFLFKEYNLEINNDTHFIFNLVEYCFAKTKEYTRAHQIIDEVINHVTKIEDKANYFDSKGDFYSMEGNIEEATKSYRNVFNIICDEESHLYRNTIRKLSELEKKNSDSDY